MVERAQIIVKGIVQGVGFRPFVHGLAGSLGLKGYVNNTSEGVLIEVEGENVPEFIRRLRVDAPALSRIMNLSVTRLPFHGYQDFTIEHSTDTAGVSPFTLVSPDVGICGDCLRELLDPTDRRYLYPFINCTNCGPRYSITRSIPYDRPNTTMARFSLCPACEREYNEPRDRRFHAQPNACPDCGPSAEFRMRNADCGMRNGDAIKEAVRLMINGGIVAIKGLGGFHIACDAANDAAVRRLRSEKRKNNKPFAVMTPDIVNIESFCRVTDDARELLESNRRPIVLLKKQDNGTVSDAVSPNNDHLGCMLPYTPLHYLLFHHPMGPAQRVKDPHFKALVMTSGNLSEEPIVRDNEEALKKLSGLVDGFLMHDRDIFMRVDDSVVRIAECGLRIANSTQTSKKPSSDPEHSAIRIPQSAMSFIRRSRGYAPDPIVLAESGPEVLGCGADVKNTFTLTKGSYAVPSQHIGDMENFETIQFFEECLANLKAVYRVSPAAIVHDLHPGYQSTRWALSQGAEKGIACHGIQHHYAHIGSVMAEHGAKGKVIGVAFDGTGYGTDGAMWGGEFLVADINGFERVGQFRSVPLPGGEAAIREPWKTAISYIMTMGNDAWRSLDAVGFTGRYGKKDIEQIMAVARSQEFAPLSSGAGRLFDAIAALLGVCDHNTFEGEAAMALEALCLAGIDDQYVVELKQENSYTVVDFSATISGAIRDLERGIEKGFIASKFHNTIAACIRNVVRKLKERTGIRDVALSGGAFQNHYLLNRAIPLLVADNMNVMLNRSLPCNDACISLGQAYIMRERLKQCGA